MAPNKEYSTDEITVYWKPDVCIHSENCVNNLSSVFDPTKRPWINLDNATTEEIKNTIDKCPSKALLYKVASRKSENAGSGSPEIEVQILKDGPLLISGDFKIKDSDGTVIEPKSKALCRCGASSNKPYCDGAHKTIGFKG